MNIEELNNLYHTFFNLQTPLAYRQFIHGIKQVKGEGYRFILKKKLGDNNQYNSDAEHLTRQLELIQSEKEEALKGENYEEAAKFRDEELQIQQQLKNTSPTVHATFNLSKLDSKTIEFTPDIDNLVNTILADLISHI